MTTLKKILITIAALAALALGGAALAGATPSTVTGSDELTGSRLDRASKAALAETGGGKVTDSERDDDTGGYEVEVTKADGSEIDVQLDEQFQLLATEQDREDADDDSGDDGAALTGGTLDRASKAALAETGGGKVTDSERDSENGATYEVEVTKDDGSQVDVRLDDRFKPVAVEPDRED